MANALFTWVVYKDSNPTSGFSDHFQLMKGNMFIKYVNQVWVGLIDAVCSQN